MRVPTGASQEAPDPFLFSGDQARISCVLDLSLSSGRLLFPMEREAEAAELLCQHCYGCSSQGGGSGSERLVTVIR